MDLMHKKQWLQYNHPLFMKIQSNYIIKLCLANKIWILPELHIMSLEWQPTQ